MTILYIYGYEHNDSTQKGLKTRPYSMDMENHIVTLPKKDLKARPYSMNMNKEDHIVILPKKGLKTRPYNIGMEKRDLKTRPYSMDMNKEDLEKLSKSALIKMLSERDSVDKPISKPRTGKWERVKPKPVPRKSISEDIILQPPKQFRNRPPKPTRKPPPIPQVEEHQASLMTNVPASKIRELNQALKGHAKSYGIELQDNLNPLNHFTKTKALVESHLESLLKDMKGFKFIETLEATFEKETIDSKTGKRVSIYKTAFFNGKAKTITKANDIEPELSMSRQEILNVIDKWVSEGSGWVTDRIDSHYINVTTCQPLH